MGYSQQTWNDDDFHYPVSAARMQHIEQAIYELKHMAVNPRDDYGADSTGTIDASSALQSALADSGWPSQKAAIWLPPGRYKADSGWSFSGGGASSTPVLDIYAFGAELYSDVASSTPMVDVTNSIVSETRVRFHGLTLIPNPGAVAPYRTAMRLNNAELCLLDHVIFTGSYGTGLEIAGTSTYNRMVAGEFTGLSRGMLFSGDGSYFSLEGVAFAEGLSGNPLNWIEASNGANPPVGVSIDSGCTFRGSGATLPIIRVLNGYAWDIRGYFFDCAQEAVWCGAGGSSDGHAIDVRTRSGKRHDIYLDSTNLSDIRLVAGPRAGGVAANTFSAVRVKSTFGQGKNNKISVVSADSASALNYVVEADAGCTNLMIDSIGAADVSAPDVSNIIRKIV